MKGPNCKLVTGLGLLGLLLATQTAFALEAVGPGEAGLRNWSQVFMQSDTRFDHVQFLMVTPGVTFVHDPTDPFNPLNQGFEGISPIPTWVETYNDGVLLTGDPAPGQGGVTSLTFRLNFSNTSASEVKFYFQVFGHEGDPNDPNWKFTPIKILSEDTVTWQPAPIYNWLFKGGSPWADVRIDCSTPPIGKLTLIGPGDCIVDELGLVEVQIKMSDVTEGIVGGQYFLEYDTAVLDYKDLPDDGNDPYFGVVPESPFDVELAELVNEGLGTIDYSNAKALDPNDVGETGDAVLARIYFKARHQICFHDSANLVTFRQHTPWTRLTKPGGLPIYPLLYELGRVTFDWTAPTFLNCLVNGPQDPGYCPEFPIYVECSDLDTLYPVYDCWGKLLIRAEDNCTDFWDIEYRFTQDPPTHDPEECNCYLLHRVWEAEDGCGNIATCSVWFKVQDTISPTLMGCPKHDVTVYCDDPLIAGPDPNYPVTATDNCDPTVDVTWRDILPDPIPDCKEYDILRVWTADDNCGNTACCYQTITVIDQEPPEIIGTPPDDTVIACTDLPYPPPALQAMDRCNGLLDPDVDYPVDVQSLHNSDCATFTITRTWRFTDACGLFVEHVQYISVVDDVKPVLFNTPAETTVYECDEVPDPALVYATDNCDPAPQLSFREVRIDGPCPDTYWLRRTWTATDGCNNVRTFNSVLLIQDTTPPTAPDGSPFVCLPDIEVHPVLDPNAPGACWARVCPETPPAIDNCDDHPVVYGVRGDFGSVCGYYPAYDPNGEPTFTTIYWTAEDDCDNAAYCEQKVTVIPTIFTKLELDIEMYRPGQTDPVVRCLTFNVVNCTTGESAEFSQEFEPQPVVLPNGRTIGRINQLIEIPCGDWDCMMVRDTKHTLRATVALVKKVLLGRYEADFGDRILLAGNLNDDCFIDILDYGAFSSVYGRNVALDTPCGFPVLEIHADISGGGMVWTEDFSYIAANFLQMSEVGCCGIPCESCPPPCPGGPRLSITVEELGNLGLGHMAVGDLNHDGALDTADVVEFMNGARPPAADPVHEISPTQHRVPVGQQSLR